MTDRLHPLDHESPPPADQRIDTLYAWIATQQDGAEGIISTFIPQLGATPLITSKPHIAALMELAANRAKKTGAKEFMPIAITLATFKRVP